MTNQEKMQNELTELNEQIDELEADRYAANKTSEKAMRGAIKTINKLRAKDNKKNDKKIKQNGDSQFEKDMTKIFSGEICFSLIR